MKKFLIAGLIALIIATFTVTAFAQERIKVSMESVSSGEIQTSMPGQAAAKTASFQDSTAGISIGKRGFTIRIVGNRILYSGVAGFAITTITSDELAEINPFVQKSGAKYSALVIATPLLDKDFVYDGVVYGNVPTGFAVDDTGLKSEGIAEITFPAGLDLAGTTSGSARAALSKARAGMTFARQGENKISKLFPGQDNVSYIAILHLPQQQ